MSILEDRAMAVRNVADGRTGPAARRRSVTGLPAHKASQGVVDHEREAGGHRGLEGVEEAAAVEGAQAALRTEP